MNAQEKLLKRAKRMSEALKSSPDDNILIDDLVAEIQRQDRHLERLGSSEAFTVSQAIPDSQIAGELVARMDYARTHRFEDE